MELPRDVAVVGAGTMGAGIARIFAEAGSSVRLCARRASSLEAARPRLGGHPVELTISAKDALTGATLVVETIEAAFGALADALVQHADGFAKAISEDFGHRFTHEPGCGSSPSSRACAMLGRTSAAG